MGNCISTFRASLPLIVHLWLIYRLIRIVKRKSLGVAYSSSCCITGPIVSSSCSCHENLIISVLIEFFWVDVYAWQLSWALSLAPEVYTRVETISVFRIRSKWKDCSCCIPTNCFEVSTSDSWLEILRVERKGWNEIIHIGWIYVNLGMSDRIEGWLWTITMIHQCTLKV